MLPHARRRDDIAIARRRPLLRYARDTFRSVRGEYPSVLNTYRRATAPRESSSRAYAITTLERTRAFRPSRVSSGALRTCAYYNRRSRLLIIITSDFLQNGHVQTHPSSPPLLAPLRIDFRGAGKRITTRTRTAHRTPVSPRPGGRF